MLQLLRMSDLPNGAWEVGKFFNGWSWNYTSGLFGIWVLILMMGSKNSHTTFKNLQSIVNISRYI